MRVSGDPISGTWTTGSGNFLYLKYDGQRSLAGVVTIGGRSNLATVREGSFDPTTGAIRLAGDARNPRDGSAIQYLIEGALAGAEMRIKGRFGEREGEATLTRVTFWSVVQEVANGVRLALRQVFTPPTPRMPDIYAREPRRFERRTRAENEQLLRERGEDVTKFVIREVREDDIVNLSWLHVVTWAATYPEVAEPPTYAIRSWQWRGLFAKPRKNWFCFVVENSKGELVGYAKGVHFEPTAGDLNKIYLLGEYQQLGLGKRMLGRVTRRFIDMGVTRMVVHAEPDNPSCGFYEATGGVVGVDEQGKPTPGAYVWRDLPALSARCPD